MIKALPPIARLHELFICNAETGTLSWRGSGRGRRPRPYAGSGPNRGGYYSVFFDGQQYLLHRVIFAMVHGRDPIGEIDHIDGNPSNNSTSNLREATHVQNAHNKRGWGKFGKGVLFDPRVTLHPFQARIYVDGKFLSLGMFSTNFEAQAAYRQAALNHFGKFGKNDQR